MCRSRGPHQHRQVALLALPHASLAPGLTGRGGLALLAFYQEEQSLSGCLPRDVLEQGPRTATQKPLSAQWSLGDGAGQRLELL